MERQRLKLSLNRRTNPRMAGEKGDGRPMVGNFSNGISGCSFRASASTSFSETKSSTSCPRSRNVSATARPGKRCPPVPPHAMTAFMDSARFSRAGRRGSQRRTLFFDPEMFGSSRRRGGVRYPNLNSRRDGAFLNPRGHARLRDCLFFVARFEHALPVNVQQDADAEQAGDKIRSTIADKRKGQAFVWQQRRGHADVDGSLQPQQRNDSATDEQTEA